VGVPFSQLEVDSLVAERKVVRADAVWEVDADAGSERMHFREIFRAQPQVLIRGLHFIGTRRHEQAPTWSFVLLYKGERVRGVDHLLVYTSISGEEASGWHEHRWEDGDGASGHHPLPDFDGMDCFAMFRRVVTKWNIEVRGRVQADLFFGAISGGSGDD
jgi:hypothetical protein